jgi:two-component system sensor histidine kinase PilS (NtrC family)
LLGAGVEPGVHVPALDAAIAACRASGSFDSMQLPLGVDGRPMRCRALLAHTAGDAGGDVLVYLTDYADVQKQIQQHKLAALGRLTASMAHEIRNPLSAVTQAAELLGEEKRAEVQGRLVRIIGDNARRIERMVRDVLALGRRDEVVREALPLAPALAGIVEELTLAGEAERALYVLDVPADATLWIDRAHLHQIVVNVLANARRYCSGSAGAIRLYTTDLPGERIALHLVDDGPGVAPDQREQVFEPFATTDPKGTGLGLYIARELADANGAQLELASDRGGAHFVLSGRRTP